jgi:dTDP-glucose 4,6-dehydratase
MRFRFCRIKKFKLWFVFKKIDISDQNAIDNLFQTEKFDLVFNFAAESHVDRSLKLPRYFYENNVLIYKSIITRIKLN